MDKVKDVIVCSVAALAAYFQPLHDVVLGVAWVFAINFICGLVAGKVVNNEQFVFRKAFMCFVEAMVLFALMASIFYVGDKVDNTAGALQCITGIVYALLYFYGVNIVRNLKALFPTNKLLAFIYYVVSIEFVNKVPYLNNFLTDKQNDNAAK